MRQIQYKEKKIDNLSEEVISSEPSIDDSFNDPDYEMDSNGSISSVSDENSTIISNKRTKKTLQQPSKRPASANQSDSSSKLDKAEIGNLSSSKFDLRN